MKAKLGRPKLEVTRSLLIGARFTPAEATLIEDASALSKGSKSEWIRATLLSAAEAAGATQSRPAPPIALTLDNDFLD